MGTSIAQSLAVATTPEWETIKWRLQAPFDPMDVDFRIQGKVNAQGKVQVLAYIDARTVEDRLDDVIGPQNWSFDWSPVSLDTKGDVVAAKGTLTIYGISKSDIGDASNFEGNKGAVSGCLKRAAVLWGIGRYLYEVEKLWIKPEGNFIPPALLVQLRKRLPSPKTAKIIRPDEEIEHQVVAANPGSTLERVTEFQQIVDSTNPMVEQSAVQHIPIEPTQEDWNNLKARAWKKNMVHNPAEWETLMEATGADYEETAAKIEAFGTTNLRTLSSAKSRKGVH